MIDRLREALADAGMSQSDLARRVGVAPSAVSQWMSGDTKRMRPESLFAAADALGVRARWLGVGKGPKRTRDGLREDAARYAAEIDADVLADIIRAVEAQPSARELSPGRRARLIALLYRYEAGHHDSRGADLAGSIADMLAHPDKGFSR